jgi:RimJ/RimL family protein N-acetyltransferase
VTHQALSPHADNDKTSSFFSAPRPWTWRHRLQQGVKVFREEGVKNLGIKILRDTVAHWELLWERPLDAPPVDVTPKVPVQIEVLDRADVAQYCAFRPDARLADICQRLASGQWCFIARYQGQIVHADWIATGRVWLDSLAYELRLAPDDVYSYDSFTTPEFRGQRIAPARSVYMQRAMREAGYKRIVMTTLPDNQVSIRVHVGVGYRRLGTIGYVQFGPWRWHFCRTRQGARPPGCLAASKPGERNGDPDPGRSKGA